MESHWPNSKGKENIMIFCIYPSFQVKVGGEDLVAQISLNIPVRGSKKKVTEEANKEEEEEENEEENEGDE